MQPASRQGRLWEIVLLKNLQIILLCKDSHFHDTFQSRWCCCCDPAPHLSIKTPSVVLLHKPGVYVGVGAVLLLLPTFFLSFVFSHGLKNMCKRNAASPVRISPTTRPTWRQSYGNNGEALLKNALRFNHNCCVFLQFRTGECLFIWRCLNIMIHRWIKGLNDVVIGQRSRAGCITTWLSSAVFCFSPRGARGDAGPISLFYCHTLSISSWRTAHTHTQRKRDRERPRPSMHRHTEPTEDRHHISTEVVNRPSEAFLQGVSSSAFIEPLSDY